MFNMLALLQDAAMSPAAAREMVITRSALFAARGTSTRTPIRIGSVWASG